MLYDTHLHEGELLPHALVHPGAEAQVGEGLLVLLSVRPKAVWVELAGGGGIEKTTQEQTRTEGDRSKRATERVSGRA